MTFTNLLFFPTSLVLDFGVRWEGTFYGSLRTKHLVLDISQVFYLMLALHICVDVSSVTLRLSDCLAADLANRKAHIQ